MVFEKPCGIVIDVRELFGSESKSQVYGHLHNLLTNPIMQPAGNSMPNVIDIACIFLSFQQLRLTRNEIDFHPSLIIVQRMEMTSCMIINS